MGLTKPRAAQIFNLDYKQSTRVVTTTNITLSGGAPNSVDGINLSLNDRVLVTGQSTGSQNGLYLVTTLGSGSNGTWARTSDGNENGEIEAGMIVMVTEGIIYADTQWKLITDDPIVINTTALTFTQNYMANSISGGTSNVVVNSNANVTISSAGTANVLTVSSTGTVTSGTASITGNVTGGNISTAGELKTTGTFLLGTQQFYPQGSDGFSVNENFNAGNATVTAYHYTSGAGRSAVVFDTAVTGQFTTGFGATGNAATNKFVQFAEYGNTTWEWRKDVGISAPNLNGGTLLANIDPGGNLYTIGSISSAGNISATGNVTGNYILGNGALLTGVSTSSSNINNGTSNVTVVSSGGNVTVGIGGTSNVATFTTAGLVANSVAATNNGAGTNFKVGDDTWLGDINVADTLSIRGQQNAANAYIVFGNASNVQLGRAGSGPLTYGGAFSAAGNVTGGNILTVGQISATANIIGGNILTVGQVSATGNVSGNFFVGNGAFLTGLSAGTSNGISNGATAISIPVASGNIAMSVAGQSNTVVINLGSFTMYGTFAGPRTLAANVTVAPAVNALLLGPVTVDDGYNITVPSNSSLSTYSDASPDIVGSTAVVSGNITGGNISTAGVVTATGNITGFNILTAGLISATGNITGGNITTAGNITGNNIFTSGDILPTANATANIGNSSFQYNTIFAKATSAQYADLAENYEADDTYEPGTVLCFGGSKEVTVCNVEDCTRVAGVVSTNPSYLMNSGQTGAHVASLALQGRVPTRVTGQVRKGDLMVSAGNGRAKTNNEARAGTIIGKALANSEDDTVIEVVVGRD